MWGLEQQSVAERRMKKQSMGSAERHGKKKLLTENYRAAANEFKVEK
jgi:hypothetical protein